MDDHTSVLGIDETTTALLVYLIPFIALVLILIEKKNKFVRFHAIQSVLFGAASIAALVAYSALTGLIIFAGMATTSDTLASASSLFTLLSPVLVLAWFTCLIFVSYRGYNGATYKLPLVGGLADKWSR